jgi:hypothetical protein
VRRSSVVLGLYVLLWLASLYPQSLRPWDTVAYIGDSLDNVYVMGWVAGQLPRHPLSLFDAPVLYPHRNSLALVDHRLLPSVLLAPVVWITGNAVLAYNLALLLGSLLCALAARHLALALGADPLGAWAAGALYAFNTYQINEAPRLQIMLHGFLPLALAELLRFLRSGAWRHAWATAGLMLAQGLCSLYHLLYGCLLLAIVVGVALVARPAAMLRRLPVLLLAGSSAALVFLPVVLPYLESARIYGYAREAPTGIALEHYVSTTPTNLFYGAIGTPVRLQQRGPHFVGFVSMALAIAAVIATLRTRDESVSEQALLPARVWVPAAAALALLFVALSLGKVMSVAGHDLGPGPYGLLHAFVPGFRYVRIPERLSLLALLFVALLVAQALTLVQRRRGLVLAGALAALVPLEHLSPLPLSERIPVGSDVPAVYRWLAHDSARAVAEVPVPGEAFVRKETLETYFATVHRKPVIHGYVSYPPLLSRLLRRAAEAFPSEPSLAILDRVGVDTFVVHRGREGESSLTEALGPPVAEHRLALLARFEGPTAHVLDGTADEVYRLRPSLAFSAAPMPGGRRRLDASWHYRAKSGDPGLAADGVAATGWSAPGPLHGDEFFEVTFPQPVAVAGVVIPLSRTSEFPRGFSIGARTLDGRWGEVAALDQAHVLQLVDQLLVDPGRARLGFDLGGRRLTGLSLIARDPGSGVEGWWLSEVEVWVR